MGWLELIRLALMSFLEVSKDLKLISAAIEKKNQIDYLALKSKALQDVRDAITEEDYKKAAKEIHDAILGL